MQLTTPFQHNLILATHELLQEGLRIPLIHALTGISTIKLFAARKQVKQSKTPPTRTAMNIFSYLSPKSSKPQSLIYLSTFVIMYLRLEKYNPMQHKAVLFLAVWKSREFFVETLDSIDINAAWYAIQGTKAKEVLWGGCKHCHASFILTTKASVTSTCPFCHSTNVRIVEP